ncbi:lectin-like protein [Salmonella sp. s55004]
MYWTQFETSCYKYFDVSRTFEAAETICQNEDAHLTSILSKKEDDFIFDYWRQVNYIPDDFELEEKAVRPAVWLGFSDLEVEKQFKWNDGSRIIYTGWYDGEPNNANRGDAHHLRGEDCGTIRWYETEVGDGQWNDTPCSYERPFVCKKPL